MNNFFLSKIWTHLIVILAFNKINNLKMFKFSKQRTDQNL
jgi:hypothetical protein